jgi:predicted alpha/beta hydrolase family esterase
MIADTPVLILPGLYNSGPDHWQTHWERENPHFRRVLQDEWARPRCADWVRTLNEAITRAPNPVLVAHSSACALVAHWSRAHPTGRVRAALLVGPSDPEASSYPVGPIGFDPMPLQQLPFRTIVVASTDDPYVSLTRAQAFADAWGSRFVSVAGAGHINGDSRLGSWPAGFGLLQDLLAT